MTEQWPAGGPADGPVSPPGPPASGPDSAPTEVWRRVHRATPLVRGWIVLVAIIGISVRQLLESGGGGRNGLDWLLNNSVSWLPLAAIGGFLLILLLAVFLMYLSWRFTRYRVAPDAVYIHKGVLFKQQRQARLDRVQSIDIVQPLIARIFGLAMLKFQVAGGAEAQVELAYLTLDDAENLRASLLAGAAGVEVAEGEQAPQAPEQGLLKVGPGRILGSLLLTFWGLFVPLVSIALIVLAVVFSQPAFLTGAIPGLFGGLSALWSRFAGESNFQIAHSPDGIRIRSGLVQTNAQTVPPGRIQAIGFSQPLLWRAMGWWRVSVNLASSSQNERGGKGVLLPVGSRDDLLAVMSLALPDPGTGDPVGLIDATLYGRRDEAGFHPVPARAHWLDPFAWRRIAFNVTGTAVVIRRGWLYRIAEWVPHERTQSLQIEQGPWQRRLRLATVNMHTTSGPVTPRIPHLDEAEAGAFIAEQAERARGARRHSGPELWMRGERR